MLSSQDAQQVPTITVNRLTSLQDEPVEIKVQGLTPGRKFTLHSYTDTAVPGRAFEAVAVYEANEKGRIDLQLDESVAGSYRGVEPMGLFWSLKPSFSNEHKNARFIKLDVTTPLVVHIRLYHDVIEDIKVLDQLRRDGQLEGRDLTSISVNRLFMKPDVQRIPLTVEDSGIRGRLFIPPGEGPFPALITMFGGHPGTQDFKASMLASHGYVSLALAFFGAEGLPQTPKRDTHTLKLIQNADRSKKDWQWVSDDASSVKLDMAYFDKAIDLLLSHPKVDAKRGIAVMSISGSVPIALLMSVHNRHVKCVLCINGPNYNNFWEFTANGQKYEMEEMYYNYVEFGSSIATGAGMDMRPIRRCGFNDGPYHPKPRGCLIPFYERHDCGFLFLTSLNDSNWPSEYHANQAEKQLSGVNHPNYKVVRYPGAGHLLEPSYNAHNKLTWFNLFKCNVVWGGETKAHCKAQEHAWKEQLEFLKRNLSPIQHQSKL